MYMYKTRESIVKAKEVDLHDVIRPSGILDLFQDIAGKHAEELGLGYEDAYNKGFFWVILSESFEIVGKIPTYDSLVRVNTWPKPNGRLFCEREYEILDKDNNLIIKGISTWGIIDIKDRKILRPDIVSFNGEFYPETKYPNPQRHKLGLKPRDIISEYDYKVLLSDCDHNRHFNNARYLDMIYNMDVINDRSYKKVEIAFIHEAYHDEIVNVKYYIDEEKRACFIGYVNGNLCFEARYELED